VIKLAKRYVLGNVIGSGGMGTVFAGVDKTTNTPIAAKRLKTEALQNDQDLLERFVREGEALRRLNHPNIVKMIDTIQDENDHYLILEYVEGGDLRQWLQREGKMPVRQALKLGIELADALTRAHHLGIIHRDLKPANVLIAQDGTPKLTDFGVARVDKGNMTGVGLALGTPDYMAPEAVNGEQVDERADLWSMGVVLFEMLTGSHPFRGETLTATLLNIMTNAVPDLETLRPDAPIALVDLIYRMMQKDRATRISSARLVGAELEAILRMPDLKRTTTTAQALNELTPTANRFATPTPPTIGPRHNLPAQSIPLVGRDPELKQLIGLFSGARLVTLLGSGGIGKTRLALEAGLALANTFEHGVYLVPLAALVKSDRIGSAIVEALGLTLEGNGREQLKAFLREKSMLLILDNFEHLLDGTEWISELLESAPRLRILATSRERLNLSGETIFGLDGLAFPDVRLASEAMAYSAVQLFVQSARRARPGYALADADLPDVARICQAVQGVPLGILLAAAWVDSLTIAEIAEEISRSLDFLESDLRDLPERQRSLRAVFIYSWNLLSERDREPFIRLAIFRGGFTREAAQQIAGATLRQLTTLQNKSLIRRNADTGRYEMHELLRQYAWEVLDTSDALASLAEAHASHYCQFLVDRDQRLMSEDSKALDEIEAEHDNVRAAWEWAIMNSRIDLIDNSLKAMSAYVESKSLYHEGSENFAELIEALECTPSANSPLLLARARNVYAACIVYMGGYAESRDLILQILPTLRQQTSLHEQALALNTLAYAEMSLGNYPEALHYSEQSAKLLEKTQDTILTIRSRGNIGYIYFLQGEYQNARRINEDIVQEFIVRKHEPHPMIVNNLGEALLRLGELDEARKQFESALANFTRRKITRGQAVALVNLGLVDHAYGRYGKAEENFRRALTLYREVGDRRGIAEANNQLGTTHYWFGKFHDAATFHATAYALFKEIGDPRGMADALILKALSDSASGDQQAAIDAQLRAFELRGRMGNPSEISDVQQMLGLSYMHVKRYEDAEMMFLQSRDVIAHLDPPDVMSMTRFQALYGMFLGRVGRYDEAVTYLDQAVVMMGEYGTAWAAVQAYWVRGLALANLRDMPRALESLRSSLDAAHNLNNPAWYSMGLMSLGFLHGLLVDREEGLAYLGFAQTLSPNAPHFVEESLQEHIADLSEGVSPDVVSAALQRGKSFKLDEVMATLTQAKFA
jgi:serine/threonine protein kinase/tetratricopeptide (TPR) repeat protein